MDPWGLCRAKRAFWQCLSSSNASLNPRPAPGSSGGLRTSCWMRNRLGNPGGLPGGVKGSAEINTDLSKALMCPSGELVAPPGWDPGSGASL